jgi:RNA polymerase sigma factor (sigma-70 family)
VVTSHAEFPPTRRSLIEELQGGTPEAKARAADAVARAYWRPVYSYLRRHWRLEPADAEDLTQEFFARAFAQEWLSGYDPTRARFRTFVRVALDRVAANAQRDAGRLKRGGGAELLSLDFAGAEAGLAERVADAGTDPEATFREEWVRAFFAECVGALEARLAARGRRVVFDVFARYDLDDADPRPRYSEIAALLGIPLTQVTNHLYAARREFRAIVIDRLRSECGDEGEFRAEARALLGVDAE